MTTPINSPSAAPKESAEAKVTEGQKPRLSDKSGIAHRVIEGVKANTMRRVYPSDGDESPRAKPLDSARVSAGSGSADAPSVAEPKSASERFKASGNVTLQPESKMPAKQSQEREVITQPPRNLFGLHPDPFASTTGKTKPPAIPVTVSQAAAAAAAAASAATSTPAAASAAEARADQAFQVRVDNAPVTESDLLNMRLAIDTQNQSKRVERLAISPDDTTLNEVEFESNTDSFVPKFVKKVLAEGLKLGGSNIKKFLADSARHNMHSYRNTQALFIVQFALERKVEGALSSSKVALPHLVLLGKAGDLEHILAFVILRNQVSLGIPTNDVVGFGGFAAEETGFMFKIKTRNVFNSTVHPNYNHDTSTIPTHIPRPMNIPEQKLLNPDDINNGEEFIRTKKSFPAKVVSTSILTQTHYNLGISAKWPESITGKTSDAGVASYGFDTFVGQTYDLSNASSSRKAAIALRLMAEQVVLLGTCAGVTGGLCATGGAGALSGLGINAVDVGHGVGTGVKAIARRSMDSIVPPSARGKANSMSVDPYDFSNLEGGIQTALASFKLKLNIFIKLQYAHGGAPDNKNELWAQALGQKIEDTAKKITVVQVALDEMIDIKTQYGSKKSPLDKEVKNIGEALDDIILKTKARDNVLKEDVKILENELAPELGKLKTSVDTLSLQIQKNKELIAGTTQHTAGELQIIRAAIDSDERKLGPEIVKRDNMDASVSFLAASIERQADLYGAGYKAASVMAEQFGKIQADSNLLTTKIEFADEHIGTLNSEKSSLLATERADRKEVKGLAFQSKVNSFDASKAKTGIADRSKAAERAQAHVEDVDNKIKRKIESSTVKVAFPEDRKEV